MSAFISAKELTLQHQTYPKNVSKILLMTYMRSGSSFVGELLKFGGNVFYVFEPFWSVYEKSFRTDTEVCFRNGTCHTPTKQLHKTNKTMSILEAIFDCRISDLPLEVLKSFTSFPYTSGYSRRCKSILSKKQLWRNRESRKKQVLYENRKDWCFTRWKRACKEASARVIKTIRLSPRLLKEVESFVHDVKVVHLIRHPLGILNSRRKIGEVNDNNMYLSARHLCHLLNSDVLFVKDEMRQKKGSVVPLTFECMVSDPTVVATKLFGILGLKYSKQTENWILDHTTRSSGKSSTFTTEPKNQKPEIAKDSFYVRKTQSRNVANAWKSTLSKKVIEEVDLVCNDLYKEIGFYTSNVSMDLSNYDIFC
ncbi:carbohydrate sulfotransferase 6-like [Saccostrea cucullata]|uniref:carbohydrate sulfotransferase 6-like n=1 Tax=Saccostrea cuccullata TaxID=36930 RepID=UPI002ED49CE6